MGVEPPLVPAQRSDVLLFLAIAGVLILEFAAILDDDLGSGGSATGTFLLDLFHYIHAFEDSAENDMPVIEPVRDHGCDEELGSVRIPTRVRHTQQAWRIMHEFEVFVLECSAINALTTCAVACGEITSLQHKVRNNAVKRASFVCQRFPALSLPFFPCAQASKIFYGLGNIVTEESDHDSTSVLIVDAYVKIYFVSYLGVLRGFGSGNTREARTE
jgi:hypothetical protein